MPLHQRILADLLAACVLTLLLITNVWAARTAREILAPQAKLEQPAPVLALAR